MDACWCISNDIYRITFRNVLQLGFVCSTTGTRDPITSALHIILGDNMPLDIVRVTSWRSSPKDSDDKPDVRYAASFAG